MGLRYTITGCIQYILVYMNVECTCIMCSDFVQISHNCVANKKLSSVSPNTKFTMFSVNFGFRRFYFLQEMDVRETIYTLHLLSLNNFTNIFILCFIIYVFSSLCDLSRVNITNLRTYWDKSDGGRSDYVF